LDSFVLSTSDFNQGNRVPDRIPFTNYRSFDPTLGYDPIGRRSLQFGCVPLHLFGVHDRRPPEYDVIVDIMGNMSAMHQSSLVTPLALSNSTAIANSSDFINPSVWNGAPPSTVLALQRMNQFLINDKRSYEESKYGAYVFDENFWYGGPQPVGVFTYTILQNTTSVNAPAIFMNVRCFVGAMRCCLPFTAAVLL
jgi:hypothetical protein